MKIRRDQHFLKNRFGFRFFILLLSCAGCVLYGFFNVFSPALWGVALGLSGSALVWAFVELIDFFIETYQRFLIERSQFLIMVESHWSQLRNIFRQKKEINDLPWDQVKEIVDDLYNKTVHWPFHGVIYSISKEFETATNYITRLFWKSHGYAYSRKKASTQGYWEAYYNVFVLITSELPKELNEEIDNLANVNDRVDGLREIDISFHNFNYPENMISFHELGDLGERISIPCGQIEYKTFKPAYDFHRKFREDPPHGAFITVMGLLFRRIKKWK